MRTPQEPIDSGFGAASTASDVIDGIDLSGRVAIVTGGYSGIGLETTRALHAAGAKVIVPARDHDKAATALKGLEDVADGVDIEALDLVDPASIDAFAERFLASGQPLHILVSSAGVMATPLRRDARGYESQFATNHLGHFQLAARLWPALRRAGGARVVSVSSWGHHFSPVVFSDPNFERREYDRWSAYGQSKTANILFALAVDERGEAGGVRAFSLHPGNIPSTDLGRYLSFEDLRGFGVVDEHGNPIADPARGTKTIEQGASTSVWCATSPRLDGIGGVYCEDCDVARLGRADDAVDPTTDAIYQLREQSRGVMPYAVDPAAADRLWDLSERLTVTAPG
jgi:NAD(P)-dependent dehydrogenase (short-subunit alcohol dehydrogenase family)